MAEDSTNTRVMKALRGLHPIRVENPACAGTPDINYIGGWIENKYLASWPLPGTIVRLDHFTPQQRCWHTLRAHAGGVSYVFLQVGREYLLFRGYDAAQELGKVTQQSLREMAVGIWDGKLNDKEFRAAIVTE
jgi:hypothetical protein